jgi:hypothetical protein
LVKIDDDAYFVFGGIHVDNPFSPQTFIFTGSTNIWTRGADLATGRVGAGCGKLPTNEKSNQGPML